MNSITWDEFFEKLNNVKFGKFDLVVAIGKGGIIPAGFIQKKLGIPMKIIYINYRDEDKKPVYDEPKVIEGAEIRGKKILLVDDVSRSGKTINTAKQILEGNSVKTFVINGKADYSLFNEKECIGMPWNKV